MSLHCACGAQVWIFDKNLIIERITLPAAACLFERATGVDVTVRVLPEGLAMRIDRDAEIMVRVNLPPATRPCARLGKAGDAIALRLGISIGSAPSAEGKNEGRGQERASNDSVITELAALEIA